MFGGNVSSVMLTSPLLTKSFQFQLCCCGIRTNFLDPPITRPSFFELSARASQVWVSRAIQAEVTTDAPFGNVGPPDNVIAFKNMKNAFINFCKYNRFVSLFRMLITFPVATLLTIKNFPSSKSVSAFELLHKMQRTVKCTSSFITLVPILINVCTVNSVCYFPQIFIRS